MNLIPISTRSKTEKRLAKLNAVKASADEELKVAEKRFQTAVNATQNGDESEMDDFLKAKRELDSGREKVFLASAMLAAAEKTLADEIRRENEQATEKQWAKASTLAAKRLEQAEKVTQSVTKVVEEYNRFIELGQELYLSVPVSPGQLTPDEPLAPARLLRFLQIELSRKGWTWAHRGFRPYEGDGVVPFLKEVSWGNEWAFSKRNVPTQKETEDSIE